MTETTKRTWRVVPASDRIPCDSWQMFRKYDGIEEFFGGFWPNEEDALAEAEALNALEARVETAERERDSIQHQEINAARREFNSMRRRAEDAEALALRYREALEQVICNYGRPNSSFKLDAKVMLLYAKAALNPSTTTEATK